MPLFAQKTVYNYGKYNQLDNTEDIVYNTQNLIDSVSSEGINAYFMDNYAVLENLSNISHIIEENDNTFLLMVNDITHEPMLLQEPDYIPSFRVDNTKYENIPSKRTLDGHTLNLENGYQMIHYHANMSAMIQLGKWFDYLRHEGVYDNTRIILVSDHGQGISSIDNLILNDGTCVSSYFPLLMVKDFGETEFTTSDKFMTNADVPSIAANKIIAHPINPFTGKEINSDEKSTHDQYIIDSNEWHTDINNGTTFIPAKWYSVHDNIWDKNNWKLIAENAVLSTSNYYYNEN